jgi:hypothetical protein
MGVDGVQPVVISESEFHRLISKRAQSLLGLVSFVSDCQSSEQIFIRPLLGDLLSQSMQLEELLDAYDARNNCRWCSFRSMIAAVKLFSDVTYELLHISHALPAYRLLPIENDFAQATGQTLRFTGTILREASGRLLCLSEQLNLLVPSENRREKSYTEQLPPGRLIRNCQAKRTETVSEMVTLLATAFLNLAAESKDVRAASKARPDEYAALLKGAIREESLRSLELRFHNLQSQYDTYVAGTQAEKEDGDLLVLRGHISVVFHLLKTATMFAHYYERHGSKVPCAMAAPQKPLVDASELVGTVMRYCITFINAYITCAEHLCREMLQNYSEVGEIELEIPRYRGFHVRPSTLIAKLVLHYGSDMKMMLGAESYDATMPLELFRANEKINAEKRRWLAGEIVRLKLVPEDTDSGDFVILARGVVLALAEKGKLIMYEQPLKFPEDPAARHGSVLDRAVAEVARLLALGKIDIESDIRVTFKGDKRVLADIGLLAEVGYGEDKFGNNIPLPEKLKYLRR